MYGEARQHPERRRRESHRGRIINERLNGHREKSAPT
jgi:hypothetical protein